MVITLVRCEIFYGSMAGTMPLILLRNHVYGGNFRKFQDKISVHVLSQMISCHHDTIPCSHWQVHDIIQNENYITHVFLGTSLLVLGAQSLDFLLLWVFSRTLWFHPGSHNRIHLDCRSSKNSLVPTIYCSITRGCMEEVTLNDKVNLDLKDYPY